MPSALSAVRNVFLTTDGTDELQKREAFATDIKVEYQWNHTNLLTGVIYKTSNNVVTKSVAYQYDALGHRSC